jgi:hypothetical protein
MKTLVIFLAAVLLGFAAYAAAEDVRTGVWTADILKDTHVEISVFPGHATENRFKGNIIGFRVPLSRLSGFTGADGDTKFTLRAAAGAIDFEGHFRDAQGAGHFVFTPSADFVREMAKLGYTDFREDSMLIYTVHDLSPSTIRELRAMGYDPSRRELDEVAIFHITPEAIREFARLGYPNLTLRELVNMRVGNVDAGYISALRDAGYDHLTAHEISEMAILGVTPKYIREMQAIGLKDLSSRQLRDMKAIGVTPEYIKEMNDAGVHELRKIIDLKATGAADILLKKRAH